MLHVDLLLKDADNSLGFEAVQLALSPAYGATPPSPYISTDKLNKQSCFLAAHIRRPTIKAAGRLCTSYYVLQLLLHVI
jgi:hypothetical protein